MPGDVSPSGQEVLVIETLAAPRPARRRRRARESEPGGPGELPLTKVTAIRAEPFAGEGEAKGWLEQLAADYEALEDAAEEGLRLLNRGLAAHRAAAGDPYVNELGLARAVAVRVGYGSGEQVAKGEWIDARELEPGAPAPGRGGRRARRDAALAPQERIAAVLGRRESLDACETLIARARLDLETGFDREAALQLRVGVEALLVELRGALEDPGHGDDMGELTECRGEVGELANAALNGELSPAQVESVAELVAIAERVLRRRRVLRG